MSAKTKNAHQDKFGATLPFRSGLGSTAHTLGLAIVSGKYKPGDLLPGELEFSQQLGVSRSVFREAMRVLAAKGLVRSRTKTGTRVTPRSDWHILDPDLLAWMFSTEPEADLIRSLFEMRAAIEPAAAALAAVRRTSSELAAIGHALEDMRAYGLAEAAGQAADQRFHKLILAASRNEMFSALSNTIGAAVSWTTIYKQRRRALPRDPIPDHEALFAAIADSSPERAQDAMKLLVQHALQDTELSLDKPFSAGTTC